MFATISNAGNHDCSRVLCRARGRAANAVGGARNQNRLASLDATGYGYELAPRDRDERERPAAGDPLVACAVPESTTQAG